MPLCDFELLRFVRTLVAFRRRQPTIRRAKFLTGKMEEPGRLPDVSWYTPTGRPVDWSATNHSLACLFVKTGLDSPAARDILVLLHAGSEPQEFVLPGPARPIPWRLLVDTAAQSPDDVFPSADGPAPPADGLIQLADHTLVCYVAAS